MELESESRRLRARRGQVSRRAWLAGGGGVIGSAAFEASAALLSLAACGGPGSQREAGSGPSPSKTTGTPEFWHYAAVYVEAYQGLIQEFNDRKTGVTVNYAASAADDYWNKLTAA